MLYAASFGILIIFGLGTAAMIARRLPALLTLPLMALLVLAITAVCTSFGQGHAGVAPVIRFKDVFGGGGVVPAGLELLKSAMMVAFFGGILSFMMQKSGVAHSMVKNGAELIGDNPFAVAVFSMALIAVLFTTIGGLGAVIMVSLVLLPIMSTVGIPPVVAAGVMLIGISLGGTLNAGNWVLFTETMHIPLASVQRFALITFFLLVISGLYFITIEMYRNGGIRSITNTIGILVGVTVVSAVIIAAILWFFGGTSGAAPGAEKAPSLPWRALQSLVALGLAVILGTALYDIFTRVPRWRHQKVEIKWYAYLIPVVPLALIIVYTMDPLAAFMCGIVYAMIVTARPGSISFTVQSMIQGASAVMPAIILFFGIGLMIKTVQGPSGWVAPDWWIDETGAPRPWPVIAAMQPLFSAIPVSRFAYICIFTICAPLALYRGPLNTWGLGFGVATLLVSPAVGYSPEAIMGMLMIVGQIQGVCDPTNTQNVWLANELRVDVQKIMLRTLPYIWGIIVFGLIIAARIFPISAEDSATPTANIPTQAELPVPTTYEEEKPPVPNPEDTPAERGQ